MINVIKMAEDQKTKVIDAKPQTTTIRQVTVPNQELKPVKYAYETARLLNGDLANIKETVMNKGELEKARRNYLLAVAGEGLPEVEGWYQVNRETASIDSITPDVAAQLRNEGRWNAVLYVNQSAINAAREKRPVALDVSYYGFRRYLDADDWPGDVARVALAKPEVARMLRLEEGEILQVTFRNGEKQPLSDVAEATVLEKE